MITEKADFSHELSAAVTIRRWNCPLSSAIFAAASGEPFASRIRELLFHPVAQHFEFCELRWRDVRRGGFRGVSLEENRQVVDLVDFRLVEMADKGAAMRDKFDQPLGMKPAHCFATGVRLRPVADASSCAVRWAPGAVDR